MPNSKGENAIPASARAQTQITQAKTEYPFPWPPSIPSPRTTPNVVSHINFKFCLTIILGSGSSKALSILCIWVSLFTASSHSRLWSSLKIGPIMDLPIPLSGDDAEVKRKRCWSNCIECRDRILSTEKFFYLFKAGIMLSIFFPSRIEWLAAQVIIICWTVDCIKAGILFLVLESND